LLLRPAEGDAKLLDAVCNGLRHGFWCLVHVKLTFQSRVARIDFDVKPTFHYFEEESGGAEGGTVRAEAMPRVDLWEMGSMIAARILLSGSTRPNQSAEAIH
jgi:hypothetical protein